MSAMEVQLSEARLGRPECCEVSVVYEDLSSRDAAIGLCRNLAGNFKEDLDFAFSWWKFKYLSDSQIAQQASEAAARADLIIFSTRADEELPVEVRDWVEEWLPRRLDMEGALTILTRESRNSDVRLSPLGFYLGAVARRTQMDFISPVSLLAGDALGSLRKREKVSTPLLDEILRHRTRPSSDWGLNE